jgi:hypothetical protein
LNGRKKVSETNGKLTVFDLLKALEGVENDAYVVIHDGEGWYNHVGKWAAPDEDPDAPDSDGYIAFTIYPNDEMLSICKDDAYRNRGPMTDGVWSGGSPI